MRLFGYFRSSAAYRCRIAFNLKGLDPDFVPVHLLRDGGEQKQAAFRSINPQGLVPALETDDGDVLTQSLAIIEWLDETYHQPPLLPEDPILRAQVRAFSQIIACDIHPLQNLRVLQYLRAEFDQEQSGIEKWCGTWISQGLAACEEQLKRHPHTGDFCFGSTPGLADICLVPQVFSAHRFGVDLEAMPRIRQISENCAKLDAFAAAHPTRQPDTEA